MRLAFFSPLNPAPSGIADYSEELLPYLAAHADITLVVDGYTPTNPAITKQFRVIDDRAYRAADFDVALYQLGNSPAHVYIYRRALAEPGVIVLHDVVLHHLIAWLTMNQGDATGYVAAMREAYGERGARAAAREILGLEPLDRFDYPLSEKVLRRARGIVVHSQYAADAAAKMAPEVPVAIIAQLVPPVTLYDQARARVELKLSAETPYVGSFGILGPTKRSPVLLDAFRTVRRQLPDARLLLAGAISPNFDAEGLIALFGLQDAVDLPGHVPMDSFQRYMAAMDVCVNLRYPTAGETSGAVLRTMAQAKAVVVSNVGWFAEIPDNAVAKIDIDDHEVELLAVTLERLLDDSALRAAMGANARRYILETCDVRDVARHLADFMNDVVAGHAVSVSTIPVMTNAAQPPVPSGQADHATRPGTLPPKDRLGTNTTPQMTPPSWRNELATALVTLGCGEDSAVLEEVARAEVELGLAE